WSSENSGAAAVTVSVSPGGRRRYSSRAACWSSGKPSKPSACENRTTVLEEVQARRASSSAVWNAASSRWSTMYWATSFCERENSSNRERMYADNAWAALPAGSEPVPAAPLVAAAGVVEPLALAALFGALDGVVVADDFIGSRLFRRPPLPFLHWVNRTQGGPAPAAGR